jgi:hypothetical protein
VVSRRPREPITVDSDFTASRICINRSYGHFWSPGFEANNVADLEILRHFSGSFDTSSLILIASAESFHDCAESPLSLGDIVHLNSGSPECLVIDLSKTTVGVSWRDDQDTYEHEFPRVCVHRVA